MTVSCRGSTSNMSWGKCHVPKVFEALSVSEDLTSYPQLENILLLMAEILHRLIGSLSNYLQGIGAFEVVVWDFFHQQYQTLLGWSWKTWGEVWGFGTPQSLKTSLKRSGRVDDLNRRESFEGFDTFPGFRRFGLWLFWSIFSGFAKGSRVFFVDNWKFHLWRTSSDSHPKR